MSCETRKWPHAIESTDPEFACRHFESVPAAVRAMRYTMNTLLRFLYFDRDSNGPDIDFKNEQLFCRALMLLRSLGTLSYTKSQPLVFKVEQFKVLSKVGTMRAKDVKCNKYHDIDTGDREFNLKSSSWSKLGSPRVAGGKALLRHTECITIRTPK
ncbi:hypothetical protein BDZ45DRAFT_457967 [Acephala macrosclerotiorum]|nr:hypothetical protein BDZ45DRAFT_457967 [Acephala macrosclerotiorum]